MLSVQSAWLSRFARATSVSLARCLALYRNLSVSRVIAIDPTLLATLQSSHFRFDLAQLLGNRWWKLDKGYSAATRLREHLRCGHDLSLSEFRLIRLARLSVFVSRIDLYIRIDLWLIRIHWSLDQHSVAFSLPLRLTVCTIHALRSTTHALRTRILHLYFDLN